MDNFLKTGGKFLPSQADKERLSIYLRNYFLARANHYDAFSIDAGKDFSERYKKLRYIVFNFPGLVSKVSADLLFGEPPEIKDEKNRDFIDELMFKRKMKPKLYASALSNSYRGDALMRLRVKDNEIYVDNVNPSLYFPELERFNNEDVKTENLCWTEEVGSVKYLLVEQYDVGYVRTFVYKLKGEEIGEQVTVEEYNELTGSTYIEEVQTGIDQNLLVHIPNAKYDEGFWGISDYTDIETLVYAVNNRLTKTDNILDKHSDPILAVPEGVLDENGKVKRQSFNMFEVSEGGDKPEYIVWNANLDSAFKQMEKFLDMLFFASETSPDVFGLSGGGQAESGRALKMRLLRTLAKRDRKRIYYEQGLQEVFTIAQKLSLANGFTVNQIRAKTDDAPEIVWQDGVVNDEKEEAEMTQIKIEQKLISRKRAIMKLEGISEKEAEELINEMDEEGKERAKTWGFPVLSNNTNGKQAKEDEEQGRGGAKAASPVVPLGKP